MRAWRLIVPALALAWPMAATGQELIPAGVAEGVVVRALDMMTGKTEDITIASGESRSFERLEITLDECRYPTENPSGDAFANLTIRDIREDEPRFRGWMIASSPAISALEHPRYDVWVLRCNIASGETSDSD